MKGEGRRLRGTASVSMGLACLPLGGATLYVKAARVAGSDAKGGPNSTGQLGVVFRESAVAHTFARNFTASRGLAPASALLSGSALHAHVPAGATPTDSPSAGCTLATALLSLALNRPVKSDLAMTGEVTLNGCVLPIGGLKENVAGGWRRGAAG